MKSIHILLFILLGLFSFVSSTNMVKFMNHCPYDIWFWTVAPYNPTGPWIDGSDKYHTMVPGNGGSVIHNMLDTEKLGGGLSLKIRDLPYYAVAPAGILQVEYHLEPSKGTMWYDLSAVDCDHAVGPENPRYCPLISGGLKLYVPVHAEGECPPAYCSQNKCWNTYVTEGGYPGEPSFMCWAGADLFVETCTEGPGTQTFFGKDPKALDAVPAPVHQAVPEHIAQPPPAPLAELKISPNGECGGTTGYTCSGSRYGLCCSSYGYCGNGAEYCKAGCQSPFGFCLGEDETYTRFAAPQSFIVATTTIVIT